jgi:TolA-binding protein
MRAIAAASFKSSAAATTCEGRQSMAGLEMKVWLRRGLRIAPLCLMASALALSGCVATKKDVRTLQQQLAQMGATNLANQDSIRRTTTRELRLLQDSIRSSTELMRTMRGQLTNDIRTLQQLLGQLQELFAQNEQRITRLGETLDRVQTAQTQPQQQPTTAGGAQQLYGMAQQRMVESPQTAENLFRQVANEFPNDPLAPDALFYRGEAILAQGRHDDAIEAFQEVSSRFPISPRAPHGLLRAGEVAEDRARTGPSSERSKMRTKARELYNKVVSGYKDSPEAGIARDSLARLR